MSKLTKQQIQRQDFVDNEIFDLINKLLPKSKQMEWNIELIGEVRDSIFSPTFKKIRGLDEQRFYP